MTHAKLFSRYLYPISVIGLPDGTIWAVRDKI